MGHHKSVCAGCSHEGHKAKVMLVTIEIDSDAHQSANAALSSQMTCGPARSSLQGCPAKPHIATFAIPLGALRLQNDERTNITLCNSKHRHVR